MVSSLIEQYPDRFAAVEMHINFDGYVIPWGQDRSDLFYGLGSAAPVIIYDGMWDWPPGEYEVGFHERLSETTDVTIDLSASEVREAVWTVSALVCVEAAGRDKRMRMYFVEALDYHPSSPSYSRNTLTKALPSTDVDVDAGSCTVVATTFEFDSESWATREDLAITVWAQDQLDSGPAYVYQAAQMRWPFPQAPSAGPEHPRDFRLPMPLFSAPGSAWVEDATSAGVLDSSEHQIKTTYKVLCGDTTGLYPTDDPPTTDWPFADITYDDYSFPIFEAGAGQQQVLLCDYDGNRWYPNSKWEVETEGGPITVPSCAGDVRPAGPAGMDSDGHLILFDPATATAYDFWQATTVRDGVCQSRGGGLAGPSLLHAGYADFFSVDGPGTNPDGVASARASGTPLLAGMILPEDIESGAIEHALAVAIPGPRNLSPDPFEPLATDYFYPAATTETDMYSTNPDALASGQRLRMRTTLVDDAGEPIDDSEGGDLAPITRMFISALRTYGAYVVDNASGFTFYAEDIHTATLELDDDNINWLIGEPAGTALPADKTSWQLVIDKLNLDLEGIPFAYGTCDGAASTVNTANYEVVEAATGPPTSSNATPRRPRGRMP